MNICIIPARGGSKRLPEKNIRTIDSVPIINRVIDSVVHSNIFDKIIVSTDCKKVRTAVMGHPDFEKIKIHSRSAKNSSDFATLSEVVEEVLSCESLSEDDSILTILPTSLLITSNDIIKSSNTSNLRLFNKVSVVRSYQPLSRGLLLKNGKLFFAEPDKRHTKTQDCLESFFDAGQFYWINKRCFMLEKELISTLATPYILDDSIVQDVDSKDDWNKMLFKYKMRN